MSEINVDVMGLTGQRGPSKELWHDCPELQIMTGAGIYYWEDFIAPPSMLVTTGPGLLDSGGYETYQDTGVLFGPAFDVEGGVMGCTVMDTDNDEGSIQAIGSGVKFEAGKPLWFEARTRIDSITVNESAFFVGIASESAPASALIVDDLETMAVFDHVGWYYQGTDTTGVNAVFATAAGAQVEHAGDKGTLTDNGFHKFGFKFDGEKCFFYVDGVVADKDGVAMTATNFPDGEEMNFLWVCKSGSATEITGGCDWWKMAKLSDKI